jgi:hypothetical protein
MGNARPFLEQIAQQLAREEPPRPVPDPVPLAGGKRLCVGMSTYDDFDGVYFTIQALRLGHPELLEQTSFLIIDNHPEAPQAEALHDLATKIPDCGYLPFTGYRSTQVRDLLFREGDAEIVLCIDSHVLLAPGALRALLDYFDARPDSLDLVQGPLLDETLTTLVGTHFNPVWGTGMWGQWGVDELIESGEPFEIQMQGLGLFACRRAAWPGINPRFRSFGGEEGYLHEKVRRNGGRAICLPALRWAHRFGRPSGIPYDTNWESRIRNYLYGWSELGWDTAPVEEHFIEHLGGAQAETAIKRAKLQVDSPFSFFDAVLCTAGDDQWPAMYDRFRQLDVGWRVERVESLHAGLELARRRAYANVLVIDGEVWFIDDTVALLGETVERLASEPWQVLRLGAGMHALAFNRDAIERLAAVDEAEAFAAALTDATAGDDPGVITTIPRISTHPSLKDSDDAGLAERYVI